MSKHAARGATPLQGALPVSHAHYVNDPEHEYPYSDNGAITYDEAGHLHRWGLTLHRLFPAAAFGVAIVSTVLIVALLSANGVFFTPESSPEEVEANASAQVDYNLPQAQDLATATAESLASLSDSKAGLTYDATNDTDKQAGGTDLIHLPEGIDVTSAAAWYAQGIDAIDAADAARLLNGSWRVTLSSSSAYDCRLRYALFNTPDQQSAVDTTRQAVGLAEASTTDQGTDSYGNTYVEGTYDADGVQRTWRVASCPLSSIYANDGLPEDASYVVVSFR